jgi:hypothetical protein
MPWQGQSKAITAQPLYFEVRCSPKLAVPAVSLLLPKPCVTMATWSKARALLSSLAREELAADAEALLVDVESVYP